MDLILLIFTANENNEIKTSMNIYIYTQLISINQNQLVLNK